MDAAAIGKNNHPREKLESAVVRFAGDSGDGMQLAGSQFTLATAMAGNDLATFPDFPAEIRAPIGTTFGVSAFQINFGGRNIRTIGDDLNMLIAMNPAALITNIADLRIGGTIIIDEGAFNPRNLRKAGYDGNPLEDQSLSKYRILKLDISKLTLDATSQFEVSKKEGLRTKNMWALGLVMWMFGRDKTAVSSWINSKFAKNKPVADANIAALNAGNVYGETAELAADFSIYSVPADKNIPSGKYRNITGMEAMAWGLVAGCKMVELDMVLCSYPITPATQLLHHLSKMRAFGVETFQAEDEIAAIGAAIGVSYGGKMGITSSSGPGIALKTEAIGLAISTELPLVIVNAQRGGPSTGMPTKTEQSDLYQAVYGRNGDSPIPVIAAASASDCFDVAIEAVRLATKYMTPVMLLTDGYLVNASEPWKIPNIDDYPNIKKQQLTKKTDDFQPFARDKQTLARPWAIPGTKGLEHRIGGIEKSDGAGNISYDPNNHQKMTNFRRDKILGIANDIPKQTINLGKDKAKLAIVGWGSTFGPIHRAVSNLLAKDYDISHIHLRHIWPLPNNLGDLLQKFDNILIPEMNNGQLLTLLRSELLIDAKGLNKVTGKPFKIAEIETAALKILNQNIERLEK